MQPRDERNPIHRFEPVYVDSQLTAELIAPPAAFPEHIGSKCSPTHTEAGGRTVPRSQARSWHGTLPPGQDRIRLTLSDLGTGRHEFVVHFPQTNTGWS